MNIVYNIIFYFLLCIRDISNLLIIRSKVIDIDPNKKEIKVNLHNIINTLIVVQYLFQVMFKKGNPCFPHKILL
jgi:hypothetical protein